MTGDPRDPPEPPVDVMGPTSAPSPADAGSAPTLASGSGGRPAAGDDLAALPLVDRAHYRIEREVARGGMGRVLLARDRRLRRTVAVKEMLVSSRSDLVRRFEREALLTARLQHPAIVSVHEAGRWSSGEPFYAMELVPGRSLEEAIAEARTLPERLALLPHAVAAVEALAYAHSQGIIHRDLKPANVLVGRYGETVVIDWGLAKDLATPEATPVSTPGTGAAEGLTMTGDVMGTPAYMAPEQAAGRDLDERADVHALGGMLYQLLAGSPPYVGRDSAEVLARVRSGPPPPLAERAPGAPADLVAIVEKAMAHDPAGRYPSAVGLADDLRRFQTGQLVAAHRYTTRQLLMRWVRRHRAAVAVAAVLLAVLAATSSYGVVRIVAERDQARTARARAEAQRGAAENLVNFVIFDLRDQLAPAGKLALLRGVGSEVDRYYEALARTSGGLDPPARTRRAAALEVQGQVEQSRGDAAAALRAFRASLAMREELLSGGDGHPGLRLEIAHVRDLIGRVLEEQGDREGAMAEYRAARAALELLDRDDPEVARELGAVLTDIGDVERARGDLAAAEAAYAGGLDARRRVVATAGDARARFELSKTHDRLGDVARARGDLDRAVRWYGESRDARVALVKETGDPAHLFALQVSWDKLGTTHLARGDLEAARRAFEAQRGVNERLVAHDPEHAGWRRGLGVAHLRLGELDLDRQEHDAALASFRAALAAFERLLAVDPAVAERIRDVAVTQNKIGLALLGKGDLGGARAAFEASLEHRRRLLAGDPENAVWRRDLAVTLENLGAVEEQAGRHAPALARYRERLAIQEALARDDPQDVELKVDLAVTLGRVARVRARQPGGRADAARLLERGVVILRDLDRTGRLQDAGARAELAAMERRLAALR